MKFIHAELLLLIWLLPLLAGVFIYGARRRREILAAWAALRALPRLMPAALTARRTLRAVLVLAAVPLLAAAMAGPQIGFKWEKVERRGVDLMIALDCSRSMLAQDIQPNRLDRAKREIIDLIGILEGDRVGLVAYSGTAFLQCPLTLDAEAFHLFLNVLTPDYLPVGGTDLYAAVRTAVDAFDPQSPADKAVILITDGEHTGGRDPLEAVQAARKDGIKVFCIGVGSGEGVPVPAAQGGFKKDASGEIVLSRLDEGLLTRMALAGDGAYVRSVAGDMDLDTIYRNKIRGGMTGATLESGRRQVWADRFQWPLAAAVALLLTALWVPPFKPTVAAGLVVACLLLQPRPPAWAGPLQDGVAAYGQGNYEKALEHFVDGQLQRPEDPAVLYNLGNAYYKNGNFKAARDHYRQALARAPENLKPDLHYNLGNTAFRLGELPEAVKAYQDALTLAPDDRQARENLEFVQEQLRRQPPPQSGQGQQNRQDNRQDQENGQDQRQNAPQPDPSGDPSAAPSPTQPPDCPPSQTPPPEQGRGDPSRDFAPEQAQDQSGSDRREESGEDGSRPETPDPAQGPRDENATPGGGRDRSVQPAATDLLDRLKDEPGRAMIPDYRAPQVEKDW